MSTCGITTFNPSIDRLRRNLSAITDQVDTILIWDDGSKNLSAIKNLIKEFKTPIELHGEGVNRGIAHGLNQLAKLALANNEHEILYLDQDSIAPSSLYSTLHKYCGSDVAIVSPRIRDIKDTSTEQIDFDNPEFRSVELFFTPITSGSLTNLDIWKKLGGFNEQLFIDAVDTEYDLRAYQQGYLCYQVNTITLTHEIGNFTQTGIPFFHLDNGKITFRRGYRSQYAPFRNYYRIRNTIFLRKYYRKELEELNEMDYHKSAWYLALHSILMEDSKISRIQAAYKAFRDAPKLTPPQQNTNAIKQ